MVAVVGALTALFAATIGLFQYDIKKVLAYSTVTQLGFMFIGVGVGAYWAGVFHLMTHAFFKACLFLGSGSVIHGMHHDAHREHARARARRRAGATRTGTTTTRAGDAATRASRPTVDPQDMRNMGGLGALMPQHALDLPGRLLGHRRLPDRRRLLLQGRDPVEGALQRSTLARRGSVGHRPLHRALHLVLHVPQLLPDVRGRPATDEQRAHVHESPAAITGVLWCWRCVCVGGPVLGFAGPWRGCSSTGWRRSTSLGGIARARARPPRSSSRSWRSRWRGGDSAGWARAALYQDARASERALQALHAPARRRARASSSTSTTSTSCTTAIFVRRVRRRPSPSPGSTPTSSTARSTALGVVSRGAAWLTGAIDDTSSTARSTRVADAILDGGSTLRRLQTGRINNYVLGVVVGVVLARRADGWLVTES